VFVASLFGVHHSQPEAGFTLALGLVIARHKLQLQSNVFLEEIIAYYLPDAWSEKLANNLLPDFVSIKFLLTSPLS